MLCADPLEDAVIRLLKSQGKASKCAPDIARRILFLQFVELTLHPSKPMCTDQFDLISCCTLLGSLPQASLGFPLSGCRVYLPNPCRVPASIRRGLRYRPEQPLRPFLNVVFAPML